MRLREAGADSGGISFCPIAVECWASEFFLLGYRLHEDGKLDMFMLEDIESFQVSAQRYGDEKKEKYSYREGLRAIMQFKKERDTYEEN